MSAKEFSGKIVFITGAGSGIGFEAALAFGKRGADIIATDIALAGLEELKPQVEALGVQCMVHILDVRDESAWVILASELDSQGKTPDIVVNNAGLGYIKPFEATTASDWRMTLDVNVLGVVFGCRSFLDTWKQRETAAHLVNLSSMAAYAPLPNMAAYAASKFAVEGFSSSLAMELDGTDIEVTCVHPGLIDTPIVHNPAMFGLEAEQLEKLQKHYRDEGVHPRVVAEDIVTGVLNKSGTVRSGKDTLGIALMKRILPRKAFQKVIIKAAREIGYLL